MPLLDNPLEFDKIVRHLRNTSVFRVTSRFDLARMLATASIHNVAAGHSICVPDNAPGAPPATSFYILISGDYELNGATILSGPRDGLVGVEDVVKKVPRSISLTATTKASYIEVQAPSFLGLLESSTPFRQALHPMMDLAPVPTPYVEPVEAGAKGSIVQFVTGIPDMPLSLLIELLAREIVMNFTDHVIVLRACPPGQLPSAAPVHVPGSGLGALFYLFVDPVDVPGVAASYSGQFDYVFLDGVASAAVDIIVKLFFGYAEDYIAPPAVGACRMLQTVIVGQPPLPCAKELYYVNANPTKVTHASDCRLRLDLVKVRALAQVWNPYLPVVSVDDELEREMGVWARALTDRRTGLALAGGGVWSMQSVFIIQELSRRGVPIDVITGASAGAMVGGYYSVLGLEGLDLLVERGDSGVLDLVVALWIFSPCIADAFFEHDLGHTCLQNLDVSFHPNSTNLTKGEGVAFTRGPTVSAMRAAASAPPLFPPTFSGSERFVDGAFSNNLAAQILPYFGANLTLGANTYPPSNRPKPVWVPNIFTRITSLGPINRMVDFTIALNLLANLTGKVEGGYADVPYNATSNFALPFLVTSNFRYASKMVAHASQDPAVLAAIDDFTARWEHLRYRGGRTWDTMPA
ncbi:MAG: patatin-like phospholipase family protein [Polyangiaceae bacterium]|nr:patatin-like phospholipase family protein [Polyangiaceae bacterium]